MTQSLATDRATFDRHGEDMTARHTATWGKVIERHHAEAVALYATASTGYQPGTMQEAQEAASSGASFLLGLFASFVEGITSSGKAPSKRQRGPDKAKEQATTRQADQQREAHSRELEAVLQEQSREREAYERRRALMLFQQAGAMQSFEQSVQDKSSLREAFDRHTEAMKADKPQGMEAERTPGREGLERDGPELNG